MALYARNASDRQRTPRARQTALRCLQQAARSGANNAIENSSLCLSRRSLSESARKVLSFVFTQKFVFEHDFMITDSDAPNAARRTGNRHRMSNDPNASRLDRVVADAIRNRQTRETGYREQALKIYPWICGRCSREFTRANLRELTVHHKNHNHDDNPSDGSNWELLCLYCHDNEHARELDAEAARQAGAGDKRQAARASAQPFANLKDLLKR